MSKSIEIKNRKARFQFEILETFISGIQLKGTEIKSIREGKASLDEAYCHFVEGELFIRSMTIAEYSHGNIFNHEPTRERKLLLKKKELEKLEKKMQDQGNTIVPLKLFLNDRGLAKLQIGLAKGKKIHDKRHSLKEKDMKREMDRVKSRY